MMIIALDEYTIDDNILIQSYVYSQRVCKQKLHSASNSIIKTYYWYLYEFIWNTFSTTEPNRIIFILFSYYNFIHLNILLSS